MDKHPPDRSGSFAGKNISRIFVSSPRSPSLSSIDETSYAHHAPSLERPEVVDSFSEQDHDMDQVCAQLDQFTEALSLSAVHDKSNPPEVPDSVETLSRFVESRMAKYYSGQKDTKVSKAREEDSDFMEAVRRISKLTNAFGEFPRTSATTSSLNRTSVVLQKAMFFMEEEFRALLHDSRAYVANQPSLGSESDRCVLSESDSAADERFPPFSLDAVARMKMIATAMLSAGYETECCQVYSVSRRNAFNEKLKSLEFKKISLDEVQKIHWEHLEGEIASWIKVVKQCTAVLFPGERNFCQSVFSDQSSLSTTLFGSLVRAVVLQLVVFADAMSLTKRSAEKLFKFLDMYETLRDLIPAISDECSPELREEISSTEDRIGEAAVNIFWDLENSIESDARKTPVPGGAVHPLTRYVLNYLKYACEYKDTLEQIFRRNEKVNPTPVPKSNTDQKEGESQSNNQTVAGASPFSVQLVTIMELLDTNLEAKSKLYRDPSLRYIFLMNNGRYILQKIKGSTEIRQVMSDTWCRKRSTELRNYHRHYKRETWGKVLECLSHEGLLANGKVNKQLVKERFKSFNMMFEEIHKMQATWVVTDEQLQSELRVSVSAVVIPAYRSFVGRFRQYVDPGRRTKYIKYQPEDIETIIEELFDGNRGSMARRRI